MLNLNFKFVVLGCLFHKEYIFLFLLKSYYNSDMPQVFQLPGNSSCLIRFLFGVKIK